MSYHRKSLRAADRVAMGDAASVLQTAGDVVSDPYFNEAICRVQQLAQIERGQAVKTCPTTPPNLGGGVGLRKAMPLVRAYVYAEKQPAKWPLIAAAAGVIGLPMLIGYAIGKGGR